MLLLLPKFDSGRDLVYNLLKQNVMAKSENVIRGRIGNMIFYRVRSDPDSFCSVVGGQAGCVEVPDRPVASDCGSPVLSAFAGYPVTGYLAAGGQRYGDERV